MELKEGTIKHLQDYIAHKIRERGFGDETVHERLLLLTEELGELVKACRNATGMNVDQNSQKRYDIGEEIADVINMAFAVGIKLDIDMEKEFLAKNLEVDKRNYERAKNQA